MAYSERREGSHAAASTSAGPGTLLPRLPGQQQLAAGSVGPSLATSGGSRKARPAVPASTAADGSRLSRAAHPGTATVATTTSGTSRGAAAVVIGAGGVAGAGEGTVGRASPGTGTNTAQASSGPGFGSGSLARAGLHASTATAAATAAAAVSRGGQGPSIQQLGAPQTSARPGGAGILASDMACQFHHQHQAHGGYSIGQGGDAAATQTTHAIQQQALRKQVQKDIQKLLSANRTYTQHVKGAQVLSPEALTQLAKAKPKPGSRPDQMVDLPDPVDWAMWKTEQLAIARLTEERHRGEVAAEKVAAEKALAEFRQRRVEETAALAEEAARKRAEEEAFARHMSAYLNHKGAVELEEFKRRKEEERERVALARGRAAKTSGFGPQH